MTTTRVLREFRFPSGIASKCGNEFDLLDQLPPIEAPAGVVCMQLLRSAISPSALADKEAQHTMVCGHAPATPEEHADILSRLQRGMGMGLYVVCAAQTPKASGQPRYVFVSEHLSETEARAAAAAAGEKYRSQVQPA